MLFRTKLSGDFNMAIFNTIYKKSSDGTPDFSIEIATPPAKTSYYAGEPFAPAGMVVRGKFSNGLTIDIPHEYLVFSPSGELTLDDNRITVTFQSGGVQLVAYQDISVEEMPEFMWWSPEMTGYTSPKPYVVSASSEYSTYKSYMAFDDKLDTVGNAYGPLWSCSPGDSNPWIMIDFGNTKYFNGVKLAPRLYEGITAGQFPKTIYIETSNDGENFTIIKKIENIPKKTAGGWENAEVVEFGTTDARYVKFSHLGDGGFYMNNLTSIADIQFHMATEQ